MRQRDSSAWGIQTGPFAAHLAHFVPKYFELFHLHTGRPILITPEGQYWEKGNFSTPKLDETEGFQCLGHSNWTICSPFSQFCSEIFPSFSLSYWEAISYYPRRSKMRIFRKIQIWLIDLFYWTFTERFAEPVILQLRDCDWTIGLKIQHSTKIYWISYWILNWI